MRRKPTIITACGRGKVWVRSLASAERRVHDTEQYFIKREGAWFRPGAHGYTMDLAEAGIFLGRDARGFLAAEGVSLVPIPMMMSRIRKQVGEHLGKAAKLAEMMTAWA